MNELIWIALCVFAVIGLAQCGNWLLNLIRRPKQMPCRYCIIPVYDRPAELEEQLRWGVSRLKWGRDGQIALLVDMGLDGESLAVCARFLRENPGLICCTPDMVMQAVGDIEQLRGE